MQPASPARSLARARLRHLLPAMAKTRVLVIGDLMLDHFIWGSVARISPEAPVPVLDFERESFMPGGAANVARNVVAFGATSELFGIAGNDPAGHELRKLLQTQRIDCDAVLAQPNRPTSVKTRVVAHKQQVVRIDRESLVDASESATRRLLGLIRSRLRYADAVIVADYGKGLVTQSLLNELKQLCRSRAIWLSLDPKPVHHLNLHGLSLITPNRKEAFELARLPDQTRHANPVADKNLLQAAETLLRELRPALLLITLGDLGMLLCRRDHKPVHIPTVAREVFDVSGAGDTVIATFTLAIAAGASPLEAAVLANHAAGIVVGKIGTATASPEELLATFER